MVDSAESKVRRLLGQNGPCTARGRVQNSSNPVTISEDPDKELMYLMFPLLVYSVYSKVYSQFVAARLQDFQQDSDVFQQEDMLDPKAPARPTRIPAMDPNEGGASLPHP